MSGDERAPAVRVEVWQQAPGSWRWRFVEDGAGSGERLELRSNTVEPTEDAAVAAAALAYPEVPVCVHPGARSDVPPRERHRLIWAFATAALSVALAAAALRYRRWWMVPGAPFIAHGAVSRLRRSLP